MHCWRHGDIHSRPAVSTSDRSEGTITHDHVRFRQMSARWAPKKHESIMNHPRFEKETSLRRNTSCRISKRKHSYRVSWPERWLMRFLFGGFWVRISAEIPTILTQRCHSFTQPLQIYGRIVPDIMGQLSKYCSVLAIQVDPRALYSALITVCTTCFNT